MIRKLPQTVINQIAAGEVIQRPFNVIKQLIENSIDAGCTQLNINILQGGLKLIKITDNGKGIMVQDFPLLCTRFATSKIKDFSDMKTLDSFGFRGEALASLSYVSNLLISSKWHNDKTGHSATFKNQQILGKITDFPMHEGTIITATELFKNSQSRRMSLNPGEEKKRIYKLLCHFCLHYPNIKFSFITEKGNQELPSLRNIKNMSEAKMQIFQQITKLSFDKFSYIAHKKINNGAEIEAIITKINCCKGKTLMLNINNRIIENPQLFKAVQKAYAECYQSIHESIQSFWVYINLKVDSKLIDCNVHPTKKSVGIFAAQQIYKAIEQLILDQIKRDSAIKVLKPSSDSYNNKTLQQVLSKKLGIKLIRQHNQPETQIESKPKIVYAFEKNRTDSKQLPIQYYSQPLTEAFADEKQANFIYKFQNNQRSLQLKAFFSQCTFVGCYGLNYILLHYQNKLFMMNIIPFLPSFVRSFCQANKLVIKQVRSEILISNEVEKFISKTKLLANSDDVKQWISKQQNLNLVDKIFKIKINENKVASYPCFGDIFVECLDQQYKIGSQIAYLLCRVFNACTLGKLNKKLQDKFMSDFLCSHFLAQDFDLSPFNQKISNFFKNRVIPILKTNPSTVQGTPSPLKYLKEMLDLKDIYKIFERC